VARKRDEPVTLSRIYTRTGDRGETHLGDLSRVPKTDARVVAYGAVDELNSQLGVVLAGEVPEALRAELARVQNDLFDLGADISVPYEAGDAKLRVTDDHVERIERVCDRFNAELPVLKSFVLPGGAEAAARLHVARTVCRRAEIEALRAEGLNPAVHRYLNRVSDLLFILARAANAAAGAEETLWKPGGA
jgi:cob(I)alamin adenosyltransferase